MSPSELEVKRREISAIVDDILRLTGGLLARGCDPREVEDREAFDIVSRIERRALAVSRETRKVGAQ